MNDFRISFCWFVALALVLPWGLGFFLYRRFGHRNRGVHLTIASMFVLAFVIGAAWWTAIHPAIWPNLPAAQPNPNAPPLWGLAILAGVGGVIALTLGTVIVLVVGALVERARPGTFTGLLKLLTANETARQATDPSLTPDS